MSRRHRLVVAGALAQRPGVGGHAWVFLNWLLGLRGLGFDVLFLDRLPAGMLDPDVPPEASPQLRWLRAVMRTAGLEASFAVAVEAVDGTRTWVGLSREEVLRRCRQAPALLNVMGYLDDQEVLAAVGRRVFVDIDPGFAQLWHALGLHDAFAGHHAFATVGLNVGSPTSTVPACGLDWVPTLPPVCLDRWPAPPIPQGAPARVTSVCTWRGPFAPITYGGQRYGLRVHELRRFAALPSQVPGARFELALDIDPADEPDAAALRSHGWTLVDPKLVAADPGSYRRYLQASSAELMVAKELYVASRGGWFSDRSACYLAAGRPVVAQDTGWSDHLPAGEGLLAFSEPAEAAEAVAEVSGNPSRHTKAAREIAADHFDASRVLGSLLDRLGLPPRGWW